MLKTLTILSSVGAFALLVNCSADPLACEDTKTCAAASPGDGGGDSGPGPACDPAKDASCVTNDLGFFVDGASGNDSGAGTKEAPVKTIGAAIAKAGGSKSNVFICAGTYAEHVKLTTAVNLSGGFTCGSWAYSASNRPVVAPTDAGFALEVRNASTAVTIQDLVFTAQPGTASAASSVGAALVSSTDVTLRRLQITAGAGASALEKPNTASNASATSLAGIPAVTATPGDQKVCMCAVRGSSTGGKGGEGGKAGSLDGKPGSDGAAAPTTPASTVTGIDGKGGPGAASPAGSCSNGNSGASGVAASAGAQGDVGLLDADGWRGGSGGNGGDGQTGQGGGGGGGDNSPNGGSAGGGGACGGCGGLGGTGGEAGGSSFAITSFQTGLTLDTVDLTTGDAGMGGKGAKGSDGVGGGSGGAGGTGACSGRTGGNGAGGSGGGGGSGGLSVGIIRKGGSLSGAPVVHFGKKGDPGDGGGVGAGGMNSLGTAPNGAVGMPGHDGVAAETRELN